MKILRSITAAILLLGTLGLLSLLSACASGGWSRHSSPHAWSASTRKEAGGESFRAKCTLREQGGDYLAQLVIRSRWREPLWSSQWTIPKQEMNEILSRDGCLSVQQWVQKYFSSDLLYGAKWDERQLKPEEIDPARLESNENKSGLGATELKEMIRTQNPAVLFSFYATGPEDLWELVYIPELQIFVRYGPAKR